MGAHVKAAQIMRLRQVVAAVIYFSLRPQIYDLVRNCLMVSRTRSASAALGVKRR